MKLVGTAVLAALVTLGAAKPGPTQQAPSTQTLVQQGESHKDLWSPNRTLKDQNVTVIPWGSGSIAQTDETANDGAYSIRISTHNYFQGGLLKLHTPVDVSANYEDPSSMLAVTIRSADTVIVGSGQTQGPGRFGGSVRPGGGGLGPGGPGGRFGGGQGPGGPGGGVGPGGGAFGPGGPGGRFGTGPQGGGAPGGLGGGSERGPGAQGPGGRFGPGGPGQRGAQGAETPPAKLDTIRIIISTTDGKKSEAYLPVPTASAENPWTEVAIPLQKVAGFENTNKIIDGVGFSGDATSTYYIGDLRLEHDPTPISGQMNATEPLNLALGDTVKLIGYGYGGATILKYVWCFDTSNGFADDAEGQAVLHKFRKAGQFVVTLQIQDYFGLKPPYTTTVAVTVNP